jgi:hypothetical protein
VARRLSTANNVAMVKRAVPGTATKDSGKTS